MFSFSNQFFCNRKSSDQYFPMELLCKRTFPKTSPLGRLLSQQAFDEKCVHCNGCKLLIVTMVMILYLEILVHCENTRWVPWQSSSPLIGLSPFLSLCHVEHEVWDNRNLVILKTLDTSESLGGLFKILQGGSEMGGIPRVFDLAGIPWDTQICIRWDSITWNSSMLLHDYWCCWSGDHSWEPLLQFPCLPTWLPTETT